MGASRRPLLSSQRIRNLVLHAVHVLHARCDTRDGQEPLLAVGRTPSVPKTAATDDGHLPADAAAQPRAEKAAEPATGTADCDLLARGRSFSQEEKAPAVEPATPAVEPAAGTADCDLLARGRSFSQEEKAPAVEPATPAVEPAAGTADCDLLARSRSFSQDG